VQNKFIKFYRYNKGFPADFQYESLIFYAKIRA